MDYYLYVRALKLNCQKKLNRHQNEVLTTAF